MAGKQIFAATRRANLGDLSTIRPNADGGGLMKKLYTPQSNEKAVPGAGTAEVSDFHPNGMASDRGVRQIPVFVLLPPRLLLLDIAGPLEVLRQANRVQSAVHFEVRYVGPQPSLRTSIGVSLAE